MIPAPGAHVRTSSPSMWRHLDVLLVVTVIVIAAFGTLMVYSSTRVTLETASISPTYYLDKQLIFVAIGIVVMFVMASIDYRHWRNWAPVLYAGSVIVLAAVLEVGTRVSGGQSWFQIGPFELEPSEFSKLTLILALAAYAARHKGRLSARAMIVILVMAAIPFVLIFKQPDLGTALVLGAVVIAIVTVGGARLRLLVVLGLIAVIGVVGLVDLGVLHKYQERRLTSFLNTPDQVSQKLLAEQDNPTVASEYNVVESKNAISNGGISGTGLFKGVSTNLSQVPEQHTDFIFSAVGEQVGLIGCALLLALFLLVMWRTWQASTLADDLFGTLVCVGVLAMLAFQVFENVGMTMGIMPVAGIPLPWMSYGGSAILVEFMGIGLVLSIRMRRH